MGRRNGSEGDLAQVGADLAEALQREARRVGDPATAVRVAGAVRTGTLPHPDGLRALEEAEPGCAERVMTLAAKLGEDRRNRERHAAGL